MNADTTSFLNYFGSNRTLAPYVGQELAGCSHVTVPFAGGMCEVPYIDARSVVVNDVHRHVINAATVAADPAMGPEMYRRLRRLTFSPDVFAAAQRRCHVREERARITADLFDGETVAVVDDADRLAWAVDYFVTSWMGRGGGTGKATEFDGGFSVRWTGSGGDSAKRFRSATAGLSAWRATFRRCVFTHDDFRAVLANVKDEPGSGVYCDSPFPDAGLAYRHPFTDADLRDLAAGLSRFRNARVVVRYYRHPLIEELYPADRWTWVERESRTQGNTARQDCLILNGPSVAVLPAKPARRAKGAASVAAGEGRAA